MAVQLGGMVNLGRLGQLVRHPMPLAMLAAPDRQKTARGIAELLPAISSGGVPLSVESTSCPTHLDQDSPVPARRSFYDPALPKERRARWGPRRKRSRHPSPFPSIWTPGGDCDSMSARAEASTSRFSGQSESFRTVVRPAISL